MATLEKNAGVEAKPRHRRTWMAGMGIVVVLVVAGGLWGATRSSSGKDSGGGSLRVTSSSLKPWPFTMKSGELRCENNAVTFAGNGKRYALNGAAQDEGFPAVDDIWADGPDSGGLPMKVSLDAAITRGLALCT
jgi:hypothetical protein